MLNSHGFDLWADGYDKSVGLSDDNNTYPFAGYKTVLGTIYSRVLVAGVKDILDVGFGTATLTAKCYEHGCTVYGQDFSARMLALAKQKMPCAQLYQGDFSQGLVPPLQTRQYDAIIATYSLHHLTDAQKLPLLHTLLSLLKEGGFLCIGDVAFTNRTALNACRASQGNDWDDDEYYFVFDELQREFPALRFEQISFCAGILTLTR